MPEQTAMLLTEQEWQDLATLVRHATKCCYGPCCDDMPWSEPFTRYRTLANRIWTATHGADIGRGSDDA